MHKIPKIYFVITFLVCAGIIWMIVAQPKAHPNTPTTPGGTTTNTPPAPKGWPSQEVSTGTIKESNKYYDINVSYPVTQDGHIAQILRSFAQDQVTQFKQDTSWATDESGPAAQSAEAGSLSLNISYKEQKSSHVETYIFTIDSYTGGAHGLEVTRTFAFDADGNQLAVTDLFTNGQTGLSTVATYVQDQLTKNAGTDAGWVSDGAAPTSDNYQTFIVRDDGVTFIFDPYQVAAYAAGAQTITVPLSVFQSVANPKLF